MATAICLLSMFLQCECYPACSLNHVLKELVWVKLGDRRLRGEWLTNMIHASDSCCSAHTWYQRPKTFDSPCEGR